MELRKLIPLLFSDDQNSSAEEVLHDFDSGDCVWLFDKYYDIFEGYESPAQIEEDVAGEIITPGVVLIWYMSARGMLLQLDWHGEEERGLFCDFLNYRLEVLGADFTVGAGPLYDKFDEDEAAESPRLILGDHLPLLFCYVARQLNPRGFRLVSFDIGDDQYYIGVFPDTLAQALIGAETEDVLILDASEGEA